MDDVRGPHPRRREGDHRRRLHIQASVLGSEAMVMPSGSEHLWLTGVTTVGALTDAGIQAGVPSRVPPAPLQLGMLWSLWGHVSMKTQACSSSGDTALG